MKKFNQIPENARPSPLPSVLAGKKWRNKLPSNTTVCKVRRTWIYTIKSKNQNTKKKQCTYAKNVYQNSSKSVHWIRHESVRNKQTSSFPRLRSPRYVTLGWSRTSVIFVISSFLCSSGENHQYDEFRSRWKRERKTVSDLKPRLLLQLPLVPGPRYLVWTVPTALADSWPDIGPLPCCWLQLSLF